jgi:hypothetical protein
VGIAGRVLWEGSSVKKALICMFMLSVAVGAISFCASCKKGDGDDVDNNGGSQPKEGGPVVDGLQLKLSFVVVDGTRLRLSTDKESFNVENEEELELVAEWKNVGDESIVVQRKISGHPYLAFEVTGQLEEYIGHGVPSPNQDDTPVEIEPGETVSASWKAVAWEKEYKDYPDGVWKVKWLYSLDDDDKHLSFGVGISEIVATTKLESGKVVKSNTLEIEVTRGR